VSVDVVMTGCFVLVCCRGHCDSIIDRRENTATPMSENAHTIACSLIVDSMGDAAAMCLGQVSEMKEGECAVGQRDNSARLVSRALERLTSADSIATPELVQGTPSPTLHDTIDEDGEEGLSRQCDGYLVGSEQQSGLECEGTVHKSEDMEHGWRSAETRDRPSDEHVTSMLSAMLQCKPVLEPQSSNSAVRRSSVSFGTEARVVVFEPSSPVVALGSEPPVQSTEFPEEDFATLLASHFTRVQSQRSSPPSSGFDASTADKLTSTPQAWCESSGMNSSCMSLVADDASGCGVMDTSASADCLQGRKTASPAPMTASR
jgi:hypothetical protein